MTQAIPSVLLVDDVDANLVALEASLSDLGCQLVRAQNGNEALRQLLKREFAVMLLDVQMPEMDGYEVARYARDNPSTREVPIIFLTAMQRAEQSVLRGYGSGAVDYLLKPLDVTVLRAKVRVFLELYSSKRRLADEVDAHKCTLAALEQANSALRHFTHAASHDLRAPLRAMRGFLDGLARQSEGALDDKAIDYLERSRRAAGRMESLLGSLLVYAGLQKPGAHAEVDCDAVLEHVRADLAEALARSEAQLLAEPLPKLRGDVDRIYQLLLNLIGNALKFRSPERPAQIRVWARELPDAHQFCVEDNGIGIDPAHQSGIFDEFERVYSQSQYEGSGLGLAICRQIIAQHGGRIWLESEPGRGSRFFFSLPRA
jgi:two-component system, sensor histidine kinase and response regulator